MGVKFTEQDLERMGLKKVNQDTYLIPKKQVTEVKKTTLYNEQQILDILNIKQIKCVFYTKPCSAPRMTRSDTWKTDPNHSDPKKRQRKPVTKYWEYKNSLMAECKNNGYVLTEILNIAFFIEMPNSWSNKKKNDFAYKKHQQKPDRDNLLKAFQDAFGADDSFVYDGRTSKYWSYVPMMIIY